MKPHRLLPAAAALLLGFITTPRALQAAPGDLDAAFGTGGKVVTTFGSSTDQAYSVAVQADGKLLVAGNFDNGSNRDFALARYTSTGALDATFGTGGRVTTAFGGSNDLGRSVAVQADGKIVVAGSSHNGSNNDFAVARYTSSGALDTTFGSGGRVTTAFGSSHDYGLSVALQADGKIVVAGYALIGGNNDFALARYTSSGVLDATFGTGGKVTTAIGSSNDYGQGVALQADGRILVVGYASNGSNDDYALARYTSSGALDTTFGSGGKVTTAVGGVVDYAWNVAVQADGKILVVGEFSNGSNHDIGLVRYTTTGGLDSGFGTGGKVTTAVGAGDDAGTSLALLGDGRFYVAGYSSNGVNADFALAYYKPDGSLETGFGSGGKVTTPIGPGSDVAYSVAVQADGRVVVAGISNNGSNDDFALVRYEGAPLEPEIALSGNSVDIANEDATPTTADHTDFGSVGVAGGTLARTFTITNTGTAVLTLTGAAPDYVTLTGSPAFSVTAQPASATVDAGGGTQTFQITFDPAAPGPHSAVVSIANDDADEDPFTFTVAGAGTGAVWSDGTLDETFGTGGKVTTTFGSDHDYGESVAVQADGKIVVAGSTLNGSNLDFALARYTSSGDLDTGFGAGGKVTTAFGSGSDYGQSVAVQADGKIVVAGYYDNGTKIFGVSNHDFALARYTSSGELDASFGIGGKVTTAIGIGSDTGFSVAVQADGKILVAGSAYNNGYDDFALVRYTSSGELDTSFGIGGKVTTDFDGGHDLGRSVVVLADGKIVVAGSSGKGSNYDFAVARYTSSGELDASFGSGGRVTTAFGSSLDYGLSVAVQADGKLVVAGYTVYTADHLDHFDFALVRFTSSGALDSSFGAGGRVTTDFGSLRSTGSSVALQADGRILVAGSTSTSNESGSTSNLDFALARYTSDGELDASFGAGGKVTTIFGGGWDSGSSVVVQPDGSIVVAGSSSTNSGKYDFALARYAGTPILDQGVISLSQAIHTLPPGAAEVEVTVERSGGTEQVSVTLSTKYGGSGTVPPFAAAVEYTDYMPMGTVVVFAEGETSKVVPVTLIPRTGTLPNRRFTVALSAPTGGAALGSISSAEVRLLAPDTKAPTLSVKFPAANATLITQVAPLLITGTAGDTLGLDRVEIDYGGSTFTATLGAASKPTSVPWSFEFTPPGDGPVSLTLRAYDLSGNVTTLTRSFDFIRRYPVQVTRQVPAGVSPPELAGTVKLSSSKGDFSALLPTKGALTQTGAVAPLAQVTLTPKAAAGYAFSHWEGLPAGHTLTGSVASFQMPAEEVAGVTAVFVVNPFLGLGAKPVFYGLIGAASGTASSNATHGSLTVALTTGSGMMSGKVYLDGQTTSFTGLAMGNGSVWFRAPDKSLHTALGLPGGAQMSASFDAGVLLVEAGTGSGPLEGSALPAAYSKTAPVPAGGLLNSATQGFYTAALPAREQTPAKPLADYPQGAGYGSITLKDNGTLRFAGVLADGTKFTAASALVAGDTAPVHAQLPTPATTTKEKGGSLLGVLAFDPGAADSDVSGTDLLWLRPAVTEQPGTTTAALATQLYTDGWPEGIVLDLVGAFYDKTATAQTTLGFSAGGLLSFSGGKLPAPVEVTNFTLSGSKVTKVPSTDKSFSLSITQSTGLMKGTFTPGWPSAKLPAFQGVMLGKGANRGGWGHFLSNETGDTDPESGAVTLEQQP